MDTPFGEREHKMDSPVEEREVDNRTQGSHEVDDDGSDEMDREVSREWDDPSEKGSREMDSPLEGGAHDEDDREGSHAIDIPSGGAHHMDTEGSHNMDNSLDDFTNPTAAPNPRGDPTLPDPVLNKNQTPMGKVHSTAEKNPVEKKTSEASHERSPSKEPKRDPSKDPCTMPITNPSATPMTMGKHSIGAPEKQMKVGANDSNLPGQVMGLESAHSGGPDGKIAQFGGLNNPLGIPARVPPKDAVNLASALPNMPLGGVQGALGVSAANQAGAMDVFARPSEQSLALSPRPQDSKTMERINKGALGLVKSDGTDQAEGSLSQGSNVAKVPTASPAERDPASLLRHSSTDRGGSLIDSASTGGAVSAGEMSAVHGAAQKLWNSGTMNSDSPNDGKIPHAFATAGDTKGDQKEQENKADKRGDKKGQSSDDNKADEARNSFEMNADVNADVQKHVVKHVIINSVESFQEEGTARGLNILAPVAQVFSDVDAEAEYRRAKTYAQQTAGALRQMVCWILFVGLLGTFIGSTNVAFHKLVKKIHYTYTEDFVYIFEDDMTKYLSRSVGVLGSALLTGYITTSLVPECSAGGMLAVKVCIDYDTMIPLKVGVFRFLITAVYIGFGNTLGIEAPTLHICCAITCFLYQMASTLLGEAYFPPGLQGTLVMIGCTTGIAAAFDTPLGGILFVIEEFLKGSGGGRTFYLMVVICTASGVAITRTILGHASYFDVKLAEGGQMSMWMLAAIPAGILGSLTSVTFVRLACKISDSYYHLFLETDEEYRLNRHDYPEDYLDEIEEVMEDNFDPRATGKKNDYVNGNAGNSISAVVNSSVSGNSPDLRLSDVSGEGARDTDRRGQGTVDIGSQAPSAWCLKEESGNSPVTAQPSVAAGRVTIAPVEGPDPADSGTSPAGGDPSPKSSPSDPGRARLGSNFPASSNQVTSLTERAFGVSMAPEEVAEARIKVQKLNFWRAIFPPYLRPFWGGIVTCILGVWVWDTTGFEGIFFTGNVDLERFMTEDIKIPKMILFSVCKLIACGFAVAGDSSGGVFFPALVIGGALGNIVAASCKWLTIQTDDPARIDWVVESERYKLCAILGMMGMFSATVRCPLSSVVIVYEMTNVGKTRADFIFPSLFCSMTAFFLASYLQPHDFYEHLLERSVQNLGMDEEEEMEDTGTMKSQQFKSQSSILDDFTVPAARGASMRPRGTQAYFGEGGDRMRSHSVLRGTSGYDQSFINSQMSGKHFGSNQSMMSQQDENPLSTMPIPSREYSNPMVLRTSKSGPPGAIGGAPGPSNPHTMQNISAPSGITPGSGVPAPTTPSIPGVRPTVIGGRSNPSTASVGTQGPLRPARGRNKTASMSEQTIAVMMGRKNRPSLGGNTMSHSNLAKIIPEGGNESAHQSLHMEAITEDGDEKENSTMASASLHYQSVHLGHYSNMHSMHHGIGQSMHGGDGRRPSIQNKSMKTASKQPLPDRYRSMSQRSSVLKVLVENIVAPTGPAIDEGDGNSNRKHSKEHRRPSATSSSINMQSFGSGRPRRNSNLQSFGSEKSEEA